jgi:hypothetical protein
VIRFSAALVAVAIGVLVGGIAASELVLVYIAIVMSAIALVVLAIGVMLKREELFGEGQGLAPAGVSVSPVLPARVGESYGQSLQGAAGSQSALVTPPSPQGAAGPGAAFAGIAAAASPRPEADRCAARPVPASQERPSGQAPPWETKSTRDAWESPAPDTRPANGANTPGSAPPSWFDRPDWSSTDVPAATPTAGSAGATLSADQDDDWPARYSWLDDEPEQSGPDGDGPDDSGGVTGQTQGASVVAQENAEPQSGLEFPADSGDPATDDQRPRLSVVADATSPADASGDTETPAAAEAEAASDTGLVTVIPGVPRYHEPDCVLIRFMPEGDNQKLSVAQAREAGCTPCTVCQPEEPEEPEE